MRARRVVTGGMPPRPRGTPPPAVGRGSSKSGLRPGRAWGAGARTSTARHPTPVLLGRGMGQGTVAARTWTRTTTRYRLAYQWDRVSIPEMRPAVAIAAGPSEADGGSGSSSEEDSHQHHAAYQWDMVPLSKIEQRQRGGSRPRQRQSSDPSKERSSTLSEGEGGAAPPRTTCPASATRSS